ncbi:uncharacterized protein LOC119160104 isoform X2 [Rhipicephalus microplus]|uniref:uncharacterized protein LOC119160104 isoform X2 n=1 Tax=Rhipicephalus microplus TaxID=6941 RepID=UPI003F6CF48E
MLRQTPHYAEKEVCLEEECPEGSYRSPQATNRSNCSAVPPTTPSMPTGKPTDFTPSRKRKTCSGEDIEASIKDLLGSCSTSIQAISKKKEALQPDECEIAGSLVAVKLKALPKRKRSQVLFEIHKLLHEAEMECLEDSD